MKILLIFLGYILGINFPDIDHKIKMLGHRSFLTHSPIVTFILYYLAKQQNMTDFNYLLIGFSFAIGIHLVFDMFPKAWTGGSIIKPFGGILFSKFYILISAVISFLFSIRIATELETYIVIILIGIGALFVYSKKERTLIRPLFLYLAIVLFLGNVYFDNFMIHIREYFQGFISLLKV